MVRVPDLVPDNSGDGGRKPEHHFLDGAAPENAEGPLQEVGHVEPGACVLLGQRLELLNPAQHEDPGLAPEVSEADQVPGPPVVVEAVGLHRPAPGRA